MSVQVTALPKVTAVLSSHWFLGGGCSGAGFGCKSFRDLVWGQGLPEVWWDSQGFLRLMDAETPGPNLPGQLLCRQAAGRDVSLQEPLRGGLASEPAAPLTDWNLPGAVADLKPARCPSPAPGEPPHRQARATQATGSGSQTLSRHSPLGEAHPEPISSPWDDSQGDPSRG